MLIEICEDLHIDFQEVSFLSFVEDGAIIRFKAADGVHLIDLKKAQALKDFFVQRKIGMDKLARIMEKC